MFQPPKPRVHILLASFQGGNFVQAQLESLLAQTHDHWTLTVSDDGSTDDTRALCERFAAQHPEHGIRLIQGPGKRSTANFFHLMRSAVADPGADWFAFCDQDDVWLPHKLERALTCLTALSSAGGTPLLYAARSRQATVNLEPLDLSPMPAQPLGFGNALLQNVASGNTMVFNRALLALLLRIDPAHAVWHDWAAYLTVTGCGGQIHFDAEPCLLYRQHADNQVGAQARSRDKLYRLRLLTQGCYQAWAQRTEEAMDDLGDALTPDARAQLLTFKRMRRETSAWRRVRAGWRSGFWRQTRSGQASFFLALALGLF